MRIHKEAVLIPNALDAGQTVGVSASGSGKAACLHSCPFFCIEKEFLLLSQLGPELYHTLRISASDVVDIAFEVGSLGNIHGRRTRHKGMCRIANAIAAAAEEFIEDIVFIGSYDQTSHREPHLLGDPAC